ncbi:hypothetical protein LPJ57_010884, partial [Coemansia sp. RSA 486]
MVGKGSKSKSTGKKRSASGREEKPVATSKSDEFPENTVIDMSSDSEYDSNDDNDEDVIEGDFEDHNIIINTEDSDEDEDVNDEEQQAGDESDGENDIHSSDIEGASSDGEEADSEDIGSDDSDDEFPLKRTSSRSTDGHATAVDSDDGAAAAAAATAESEYLDEQDMQKLTIRDFGKDLESWK